VLSVWRNSDFDGLCFFFKLVEMPNALAFTLGKKNPSPNGVGRKLH